MSNCTYWRRPCRVQDIYFHSDYGLHAIQLGGNDHCPQMLRGSDNSYYTTYTLMPTSHELVKAESIVWTLEGQHQSVHITIMSRAIVRVTVEWSFTFDPSTGTPTDRCSSGRGGPTLEKTYGPVWLFLFLIF